MHSSKSGHRLNFLITAGGTREYIDPVRFISNASSGRMGYELARAAATAGHKVTLVKGPSCLPVPAGVRIVKVETSAEMFAAVRRRFEKSDCLIMAAAVSDYAPLRSARAKIKKSRKVITLKLKPTPDILKWAGSHKKKNQLVVGFALEDRNLELNAERKMRRKNLDMMVANTPAAIGAEQSEVFVKMIGKGWVKIAIAPKRTVARRLIAMIQSLIPKSSLVNSDSNL
jgi:phosphopantothenoylcysteine decarboxylase/phosphopantothenate--cysteine ligase